MPDYRIGKLKGRFVLVFTGADGKRRRARLVAKNADEARRVAPGAYAELTRPRGKTVADLWNSYTQDKAGRAVIVTMTHTWKALRARFGAMAAEDITVPDCRAHVEERRSRGIRDSTLLTELGHLRMVLNWAEKQKIIVKAPYIERPPKPKPREAHLTKSEARSLMDAATMPHIRLFVVIALGTGARNAALLGGNAVTLRAV